LITFDAYLSVECHTFLLSSANLISYCTDFSLIFIVWSVFFIQQES
jgi:hypothetical protein